MIRRLEFWWYITKNIWQGNPVRTWRRVEGDRYACDGDCGRYSLHGICTCGISHLFKIEEGGHKKVARDNVSWHREHQTDSIMMNVPFENECPHGLSWNIKCDTCHKALNDAVEAFMKEWNNDSAR